MAEIPDLVNYRENHDLTSPEAAFEYIKKIALQIEDGSLAYADEEFLNYITDVQYRFDYEEIFVTDELPNFTDFPDIETYQKTIEGVEAFKPTLISTLVVYNIEKNDLTTAEEHLERLVDQFDFEPAATDGESETQKENEQQDDTDGTSEKDERSKAAAFPLLPYFRSRIALANPYDPSHPDLGDILRLAKEAMSVCDDHYLIRVNYAQAVARAYEDDLSFEHQFSELPDAGMDLINDAIDVIDGAIAIKGDYGPAHAVRARLYALRGELQDNKIESNFEDARSAIKTAIELEGAATEASTAQRREYTRIQREIRLREQTATTRHQVSEADKEVSEMRKDLKQTVDRYRRNTLSFIGFFAALITLAVTSIQILSASGGTLADKAILIIVQAGALVFAFGAFGLLLPSLGGNNSRLSERFNSIGLRAIILVGLGLIVLGAMIWVIPGLPG